MAVLSHIIFAATLSFAGISAHPLENQNWEVYTNSLGYTTSRFKPGMEPGSDDYIARFGNLTADLNESPANMLIRRDDSWRTEPYSGSSKIAYGCETDIARTVLSKLHDACHDTRCDSGTPESAEVKYPDNGNIETATVELKATGAYPSGMKHAFIEAIQALVVKDAVEIEDVSSYYHGSPHNPSRYSECPVYFASNFLSVVVRDSDSNAHIGNLDVELSFKDEDGDICGTVLAASGAIVGLINGVAGGIFGLVQAVSCS